MNNSPITGYPEAPSRPSPQDGVSTQQPPSPLGGDVQQASLPFLPTSAARLNGDLCTRQIQPLSAPNNSRTPQTKDSLHNALTALAQGDDLINHMETFRQYHGSITSLIPYLEKTVSAHPEVLHTEEEWIEMTAHHHRLFTQMPEHFLTERFYMHWCVTCRSFEALPATLPAQSKQSIYAITCAQFPVMFEHLPRQGMSAEICEQACDKLPRLLQFVPDEYRSPALCLRVCREEPWQFTCLRGEQKTADLALLACRHSGEMLKHVDLEKRTLELCTAACQNDSIALRYVPLRYFDTHPELYMIACQNDGMALQYIPYQKRTPELCKAAVISSAQALTLVPEHCKEQLYAQACSHSGAALKHVPAARRTPELCTTAFNAPKQGLEAFHSIPVGRRTQAMYEAFCRHHPRELREIPGHIDRARVDSIAVQHNGTAALQYIPPQYCTPRLCVQARRAHAHALTEAPVEPPLLEHFITQLDDSDHWSEGLHRLAQTHLGADQYRVFLFLAVSRTTRIQLQVLTCPLLCAPARAELINFLSTGRSAFTDRVKPGGSHLFSHESPLQHSLPNTSKSALLVSCYSHCCPTYQAEGNDLERYIATELEQFKGCEQCPPDKQPPLHRQGKLTGGRTIVTEEGDTIVCYKFQKHDEPLQALVREGLIHQYRKEHPDSRLAQMVSELPYEPSFLELDEQNWPTGWELWPDPPCIQTRTDQTRYINVYRYRTTASYHRYAHQHDSNSIDPYKKPESGLLAACHDMGLMAGMGLPLTSMLPAFHATASKRDWLALHSLLGYRPFGAIPGVLEAWNSVATEYPDISYSGIRDIGDYEPCDAINSVLHNRALSRDEVLQPTTVHQKLAFASIICDNLLAAILVRSRLRQQSPDYHIDNSTAVRDTMDFIEEACRQFAIAMAGYSDRPDLLANVMRIDNDDFYNWLKRAASEVVYWTAAQPNYKTPDTPAFSATESQWDHRHCYALDLRNTGRLCTTLYPNQPSKPSQSYPDSFHNRDKHLNLGGYYSLFPLIALMEGFTTLTAGLFTDQSAASTEI